MPLEKIPLNQIIGKMRSPDPAAEADSPGPASQLCAAAQLLAAAARLSITAFQAHTFDLQAQGSQQPMHLLGVRLRSRVASILEPPASKYVTQQMFNQIVSTQPQSWYKHQ